MVIITWSTWGLFTESIGLAMDAVPRRIDIDELSQALIEVPGVVDIQDLHVWGTSTSEIMLTAHLVITDETWRGSLEKVQRMLNERFSITRTTLQFQELSESQVCLRRPSASI
jgi:cobalt-zinc-cadmium efflux system protein